MKRIGVLAVASLLSVGAMAGDHTLSATGRLSLIARDNDTSKTGLRNSSAFEGEFLRVYFDGVLNASTKYHMVLDPAVANFTASLKLLMSSTPLWEAASISITSRLEPSLIDLHDSHLLQGFSSCKAGSGFA